METPHRRYMLEIKVNADTWQDVLRSLEQIAFDLHSRDDGGVNICSGSPSAGYTVIGTEDSDMTHERYFADVEEWLAEKRAE